MVAELRSRGWFLRSESDRSFGPRADPKFGPRSGRSGSDLGAEWGPILASRGVAFVNAFRAHVWGQRGTPKPCPRDAKLSSAACVLAPRRAKKRIDYRSRAEGELPSTSDQRYDRPPSSTAYLAHRTADARPATSEHKAAQSTPACSLTRPTGEQPHLTSGSQSITQRILRTICHDPLPPNLGSKNDPPISPAAPPPDG